MGRQQIANFTTHSWPHLGSALLGLYALGVTLLLVWQLVAGRRAALRERARGDAGALVGPQAG